MLLRFATLVGGLVLVSTLVSCTQSSAGTGRIRVFAEVSGTVLNLSATLEGPDGQSLSGALATLEEPSGTVVMVPFNANKNAYVVSLSAQAGEYKLQTDSTRMGKSLMAFPVKLFANPPDITSIQDGIGAKAEEFKKLSAATPIRLEWKTVEGAQRYLVELRQGGRTIKSLTVSENSWVVPANVFQGNLTGTPATVQITANAFSGDLSFSRSFFSNTSLESSSYTFQVAP
jgi:hypothetical protein